jgi:predicted RNase H-like nuclease (RuvC/YqgF family)
MAGRTPLIVGIDPGTTTGVAAFDLEGNLVFISSRKSLSRPELIRMISGHGEPIIIASEKNPVPRFFSRFGSSTDARLVYPREVLSRKEKFLMAREFRESQGRAWRNSHERDALVAALGAWKSVRRKVRTIDRKVRLIGLSRQKNRIRKDVLVRGISIDRSIRNLSG